MEKIPRFLCPEDLEVNAELTLSSSDSKHLSRVLRMGPGDSVGIVNGRGAVAVASVVSVGKTKTEVRIESVKHHAPGPALEIVFGVTKSPAMEFIFRRGTEVGVTHFQPVVTEHSLRPKSWNAQRWTRILVESAKQCQALFLPEIASPLPFFDFLGQRDKRKTLVFCDEDQREEKVALKQNPQGYHVLIGPEGGWSETERTLVGDEHPVMMGMGPHRLRAETAAVAAAVRVQCQVGGW